MSDDEIRYARLTYRAGWTRTGPPDPHPDIVTGEDQRIDQALREALQEELDRALFEALVPGVNDVTPNTLEAPHE